MWLRQALAVARKEFLAILKDPRSRFQTSKELDSGAVQQPERPGGRRDSFAGCPLDRPSHSARRPRHTSSNRDGHRGRDIAPLGCSADDEDGDPGAVCRKSR